VATAIAAPHFDDLQKEMKTFKLTKDSEVPGFEDLGFWRKKKEIERLYHCDPTYRKEQIKYGIPVGMWLGLSNSLLGWIAYGFTGLSFWLFLAIILGIGINTTMTIRLHRMLVLNQQVISAYRRQIQSEVSTPFRAPRSTM
jgi:hypothetical protein